MPTKEETEQVCRIIDEFMKNGGDCSPGKLRQGSGHYFKKVDGELVPLTEEELDLVWGK
jgi:cyclophilin family peptidyl-prolyl cis-trans isomerase